MVRNTLKYKLMNILYNLASCYSQLAVAQSRGGKGLKTAAEYFASASGVLDHMRKEETDRAGHIMRVSRRRTLATITFRSKCRYHRSRSYLVIL
ncbi:hypothetical protein LZ30DRAFT_334789 [Colletotrichum cereale]|nr:hypothetical protein LZ30DRAFT_334789 [Colletotrichum cereale]